MKILVHALMCSPYRGSEPGVAWSWLTAAIKQGHDLTIVTAGIYQSEIEQYLQEHSEPSMFSGLRFVYLPLLLPLLSGPAYVVTQTVYRLNSLYWLFMASQKIRTLLRSEAYDCVHYLTMTDFRSVFTLAGLPSEAQLILGPLTGSEYIPSPLFQTLTRQEKIKEGFRWLVNQACYYSPLHRAVYARAAKIYLANDELYSAIPAQYHAKAELLCVTACDSDQIVTAHSLDARFAWTEPNYQLIYVGRQFYMKGFAFLLAVFARVHRIIPQATLTLVGATATSETQARQFFHSESVPEASYEIISWLPRDTVFELYQRHALFLMTSFRDSAPTVIWEAFSMGLPVVSFLHSGPGFQNADTSGVRVSIEPGDTYDAVLDRFAQAVCTVLENQNRLRELSYGARERALGHTWDHCVRAVYESLSD